MHCKECGSELKEGVEWDNTKLFICDECHTEKIQYISGEPCKHEYTEKSGDACIHCGIGRIHFME
jgi:hypothetical protein